MTGQTRSSNTSCGTYPDCNSLYKHGSALPVKCLLRGWLWYKPHSKATAAGTKSRRLALANLLIPIVFYSTFGFVKAWAESHSLL